MSSVHKNGKTDMRNIFEKFKNDCDFVSVGEKILGKGAFGEVRDIKFKNKTMAGKLIKKSSNETSEDEKYAIDLRSKNIIKISKVYTKNIGNDYYDLIIMEKAVLRDMGKLSEFYHHYNLLKLIYEPFYEPVGDNLLRFYSRQIINALEVLNRNYLVHYDLKPDNLLIAINLILKLSDFDLLRKVKDEGTNIPGGTPGYITPEYYIERNVTSEEARKQDYFALGSTLFFLKFGKQMLNYKKTDNNKSNSYKIIDGISKSISKIQSSNPTDKDFIDFLISLIQYKPQHRPSFEQIYRNKWLNKDIEYLDKIFSAYEKDEEKLILEFQKNDFLMKKEKDLDMYSYQEKNENFITDQNQIEKNEIKHEKPCRFRFKKKINII